MLQDLGPSMNGTLRVTHANGTTERYENVPLPIAGANYTYPNGTSIKWSSFPILNQISYLPDGTFSSQNGEAPPYGVILAYNPLGNCKDAAEAFVNRNSALLEPFKSQSVTTFTSDYGLYWWDYQSGYDVVLAEIGWNNTVAQEIGLVRGAANLQGKSWGTIVTWTYTQEPYLTNGDEMYNQMRMSYESGAEYVLVFNYAKDMNGVDGILQAEHFHALERFWNEVVQNSNVKHGGVEAEAALVLPKDFGWGMRRPTDTIWGLWNANSTSQQIWAQVQDKLAQYGLKLDIVYEDSRYSSVGKYNQVLYWNQTS